MGYTMREEYLKKFHELKLENINNGLGIVTKIDWIDLDSEYKKSGNTVYELYESQAKLVDESDDLEINSLLHNPVLENKIDYLHNALRNIKILIIKEDGEYIITRKVVGNQYNHLIIKVEENITATVCVNTISINNLSVATEFLDVICAQDSDVTLIEMRDYGDKYFIYSRKNVYLNNNSSIKWTNIEGPSKLNITKLHSILNGYNSVSLMSTLVLSRNSEYNIFTRSDHNFSNTKSLMRCRSIMNHSRSIMRGLIYIHENASNSNGYQKNEVMMLDNSSRAISIPDLEIHNAEVKCTHGSTISHPDKDKIFYLQSRGLDESDSKNLLIQGFYEELISQIPEKLKENIRLNIEKILSREYEDDT